MESMESSHEVATRDKEGETGGGEEFIEGIGDGVNFRQGGWRGCWGGGSGNGGSGSGGCWR